MLVWRPQGDREFSIEVNLLNALRHPNIVRLLGICTEEDHRLAVFELATLARGSMSADKSTCMLLARRLLGLTRAM